MPICCEPGKRFPIYLESDKDKQPRPTFYCRSLNMRQQIALGDAIDALHETTDQTTQELFTKAIELATEHIDGWEHMPDGFELWDLNYYELRQLLTKIQTSNLTEPIEKKELESRPSYAAARCATDAP